jgi:glycine/D-amino acid oxidase-like deaminating enzyme
LEGHHETVIIGGGIAGLACARRLHDSGRSFVLITEDVGGRVRASGDGSVNLGAYYVKGDYEHVNQFVDRGRRIRRRNILRGQPDGSFTRTDVVLVMHPVQAVRFLRFMLRFRRHYEAFKRNCLVMPQAAAIRADPLLNRLYHEPVPQFIERLRIEDIAQSYLAPAAQGTAFTSMNRLTALTLIVGVLPLITPIHEYRFRFDRLTAGFENRLEMDSVTAIDTIANGGYSIRTRSGRVFTSDNAVVATPIGVSAALIDLPEVKAPIDAHMFVVEGELREPWDRASFSLFPDGDTTLAIAHQAGGSVLFCSASSEPDFGRYFSLWEVIEYLHWNPAFHLVGDALIECHQGPGLYVIGDHNVCDLEDAFITGVYAADQVVATSEP